MTQTSDIILPDLISVKKQPFIPAASPAPLGRRLIFVNIRNSSDRQKLIEELYIYYFLFYMKYELMFPANTQYILNIHITLCIQLLPNLLLMWKVLKRKKIGNNHKWQHLVYYGAVSEWVTERVLCEDKTHSTELTMSDPHIMLPNKRNGHSSTVKHYVEANQMTF